MLYKNIVKIADEWRIVMLKKIYIKIKRLILDSNIFLKLIIFTIFVSALPLLVISFIFNSKIEQIISNELSSSYEQIVNQYVLSVNYKIDIYQTLLTNIASNRTIVDLLSVQDKISANEAYDIGDKIRKEIGLLVGAQNISELRNIMIYSTNEKNPIYAPKISNVAAIKDEQWYKVNIASENKANICFLYKSSTREDIFSYTKAIVYNSEQRYGEKAGFVKLDINPSLFFGSTVNQNKSQNATTYVLNNGKEIFSSDGSNIPKLPEAAMKNILELNDGVEYGEVSNEKVVIIHKKISQNGFKALFLFKYGEIEKKKNDVRNFIITFSTMVIIIILCLTVVFSKYFSKRIRILINKMEKVQNGDMKITEKIDGNDEIGIVDNHFNKMVVKLQMLINNNYIQQLEKREAELNALQFQINPHFLYNTLETINSIAAIQKCYEVCEISQKLGEMFRYSININKSEFVTLEKELKHIENYIYIQKIRFRDKFEVFFSMSDEVKKCKVLRFILQPIVENAIIHGFKDSTQCGCIEIAAYIEANKLILRIEDDGNGITDEQVEYLNAYINKRNDYILTSYKRSIGVKNVNMRIKLACGDEYGILFKSKVNVGTQVIFTLPLYGFHEEGLDV